MSQGWQRNTAMAATGDTDPVGPRHGRSQGPQGTRDSHPPHFGKQGWSIFFLARAEVYPKLLFPVPAAGARAGDLTSGHWGYSCGAGSSCQLLPCHRVGRDHSRITQCAQTIPTPPASYLEPDNMWNLHAIEVTLDLGNATASCHGLQGAGRAVTHRVGTQQPPYPCHTAHPQGGSEVRPKLFNRLWRWA